jgi:tRNA-2-methylthio-N6-dimethylallyladenosine synthase
VLAEARALAAQGVREITLIGQNVNAYHGGMSLAELIAEIAQIESVARIRYTTSHPLEMSDALIALHGQEPKLMPQLHLPVQSGSTRILKAMNRRHSAEDYLRIVEKLRAVRPDIALSTDFIVGFPGEREQEFEETMALARAVQYAASFSFKYSRRPGTPAASMAGQVPEEAKTERLARLQALLNAQQSAFNAAQVERTLPVLVAGRGRKAGQAHGRSPYLQAVHFDGDGRLAGEIVSVRIVSASQNSLTGVRADACEAAA